jgi:hypothetical protein
MEWTNKFTGHLNVLDEDKINVEIKLLNEITVGLLYFEKPKVGWINKPIMPTKWRCVDAKLETVYVHGGKDITPKDLVAWGQDLIQQAGY